jgi:hypothetical protein
MVGCSQLLWQRRVKKVLNKALFAAALAPTVSSLKFHEANVQDSLGHHGYEFRYGEITCGKFVRTLIVLLLAQPKGSLSTESQFTRESSPYFSNCNQLPTAQRFQTTY